MREPWQERVIEEHQALVQKIERLQVFLDSNPKVPMDELYRLGEQLRHMGRYAEVLKERIDNF